MQFCPKCGSMMMPKKQGIKQVSVCRCGYTSEGASGNLKEAIKKPEEKVGVVDSEVETLPITDADCPKCKHSKAYYWTMQTRAADEGETKFLKCANCKYTWRDYG